MKCSDLFFDHGYRDKVQKDFSDLLLTLREKQNKNEREVQKFIENHPTCILGALSGIGTNYQIFGRCVIAEPGLKSYDGDRRPDFLVVTWNSLNLYFNFIEIECPSKKIFKEQKLEFRGEFHQAENQLNQWNALRKDEVSAYCNSLKESLFKRNFNLEDKTDHFNFILVYGFSDEVTSARAGANKLLNGRFSASNLHHWTYSRMIDSKLYERGLFCVKKREGTGDFTAISCSPFLQYRAEDWSDYHNIKGKEEIVKKHDYIPAENRTTIAEAIQRLDKLSVKKIWELIENDEGISFF